LSYPCEDKCGYLSFYHKYVYLSISLAITLLHLNPVKLPMVKYK
jgi:hypothetical protein